MDTLATIQSVAAAQISASHPTLTVLTENGMILDAIEEALGSAGACAIVEMPIDGAVDGQTQDATLVMVSLAIRLLVNIQVAPTFATLATVETIHNALKAYSSDDEANRFVADSPAFALAVSDSGLIEYDLFFSKMTALSTETP